MVGESHGVAWVKAPVVVVSLARTGIAKECWTVVSTMFVDG